MESVSQPRSLSPIFSSGPDQLRGSSELPEVIFCCLYRPVTPPTPTLLSNGLPDRIPAQTTPVFASRTGNVGLMAVMRGLAAHRFDGVFHIDASGFLEAQCALHLLAFFQRLFQPRKHHVIPARLEVYGLARLDLDTATDRSHLHHAAFHLHVVNFEASGKIGGAADQLVGPLSGVGDFHITGGERGALRRRTRPGMVDL